MTGIRIVKRWSLFILAVFWLIGLVGCQTATVKNAAEAPAPCITLPAGENVALPTAPDPAAGENAAAEVPVIKGQNFSTRDEVAAYIHQFRALPPNFITKTEAQKLGWDNAKGNLWKVTDHKSIGGDRFGNREGLLPTASGRQYYECDINYRGGYRGAERIVYSNDGLIFYTGDHYNSFTRLY